MQKRPVRVHPLDILHHLIRKIQKKLDLFLSP